MIAFELWLPLLLPLLLLVLVATTALPLFITILSNWDFERLMGNARVSLSWHTLFHCDRLLIKFSLKNFRCHGWGSSTQVWFVFQCHRWTTVKMHLMIQTLPLDSYPLPGNGWHFDTWCCSRPCIGASVNPPLGWHLSNKLNCVVTHFRAQLITAAGVSHSILFCVAATCG